MKYLTDTSVITVFTKPDPPPQVTRFLRSLPSDSLYLSVITLGEINKAIAKHPQPERRQQLALWLHQQLIPAYADRILPFDQRCALTWGDLSAMVTEDGPAADVMIAATARAHNLTVITRRTDALVTFGVTCLNPWLEEPA